MPHVPDTAYFPLAPDWLCEIISPSTARLESHAEARHLRARRRQPAWLLDPLARTLEVLRLTEGRWTIVATHAGDEVVRAEPFDAIEFTLSEFWAE